MLAPGALMIKCGKLRELRVLRRQITFMIDRQISHPIRAALIHRDDFAVAHVGDRVRAF